MVCVWGVWTTGKPGVGLLVESGVGVSTSDERGVRRNDEEEQEEHWEEEERCELAYVVGRRRGPPNDRDGGTAIAVAGCSLRHRPHFRHQSVSLTLLLLALLFKHILFRWIFLVET